MNNFFADMADNPFLLSGLLGALSAGVACGIVGPYVVTRRIVFLAAAIAHIALGGIGLSIYLSYRWPAALSWLDPLLGAAVVATISAVVLAWLSRHAGERLDTLIGALWSVGMALGILLIKLTPGYHTELLSYLFGNLSMISPESLRMPAILAVVVVAAALLYHKRFLAVCLDEEQARLQGLDPFRTDAVLLVLVALTVITLTQVIGLILVIALLSLPAAVAVRHVNRLGGAMVLAVILCVLVTTVPRIAVYGTRISPEPAIVLSAGGVYALSLVVAEFRSSGRFRSASAERRKDQPSG